MDNTEPTERPTYRRRNGRLKREINGASAKNARTKKVTVRYGGNSRVLREGVFDPRGMFGRAYNLFQVEYMHHLGNDLTVVQEDLCDMAARLKLIENLCAADLDRRGVFDGEGKPRPALDAMRRVMAERREVLKMIGLKRAVKEVPTLAEYLATKSAEATQEPADAA